MQNLNNVAELAMGCLKKNGAEKAQVEAGSREVHELNVEANRFTLLRTTFDQGVSLRAITGGKQASQSANQFGEPEIAELASQTMLNARSSAQDPAFDISPMQPPRKFRSGPEEMDGELMTDQAEKFLGEVRSRFPKIILEQMTVQFVKRNRVVANTNGVHFESAQNDYEVSVMFTGKDGKKTSSFNYVGASAADFKTPVMKLGGVETLLQQSSEQTDSKPLSGKFVGDIVVTPHCLSTFIDGFTGYLGTGSLLKGQSLYKDKLGEKIAVENFSLRAQPLSARFSLPKYITADGFANENFDIVESGRLKTFLLDQYGANKLKKERAKGEDGYHMIDPGQKSLSDMIRSIEKGLLLCRYSSGYPAVNGDISGVAKNSFLIENGEIRFPVSECMVSANIAAMLLNIQDISRETINFGTSELPWVQSRM